MKVRNFDAIGTITLRLGTVRPRDRVSIASGRALHTPRLARELQQIRAPKPISIETG